MKRYSIFTIVSLVIFFVGIIVVAFLTIRYSQSFNKNESAVIAKKEIPTETAANSKIETSLEDLSEAKAVRIAEEFIAQNGYTDLPADKNKLSHETVEFADNLDELLKSRANTLERKAYGILYKTTGTKMGQKGWTVVFQSKNISEDYYKSISQQFGKKITEENYLIGRAVTIDENFQNLLLEHKDFPLQNVDKKL